jgi:hypothetical protein
MYLSTGLSWLGYPDRAWAKSRQMLGVAQRSSVPYVLAQASIIAEAEALWLAENPAPGRWRYLGKI